jgi:hypothetical protein
MPGRQPDTLIVWSPPLSWMSGGAGVHEFVRTRAVHGLREHRHKN